ncbi:DNA-processing protein DprA [Dyadobacter sandarakinus]|uniref:DNA-protecting protein DprA n=1 Tax=Dyadobacter sandarakinus TaxID=2747268 RepID=A0ABX7I1F9_9BACT|nr:DNA-processing protein DprA [Dyadobacter sandarakinus]QRQ99604.1 DNA-protecting protein DprA [Dyadobacter sandarakinus]
MNTDLSDQERVSTLALMHTPGIGSVTVRQLISYCGSATAVFTSGYKKLIRIPGIGDKIVRAVLDQTTFALATQEYGRCRQTGTRLHFFTDPTYPTRLKPLYDAPVVLYTRGSFDFNMPYTVGIVGTRQVSEYGKAVTETIIRELMPFNPLIVSGLAYGVDITAHRASLKCGLPTIGVMASGLDVIYPASHARTAQEMMQHGGLVTENALATKPDHMRFPARNRIIAGLSDVTIVVESGKKGGSLITVEFAQNYHREVFAVPGMISSPLSEGCNQLIRDNKASIFTSVEDMAGELGWIRAGEDRKQVQKPDTQISFDGFTQDEGQVLSLLRQKGTIQIDELAWHSGMHMNKLATLLLNLEFQGMVRSMPGKKYSLI